jgi:hypothetical protein
VLRRSINSFVHRSERLPAHRAFHPFSGLKLVNACFKLKHFFLQARVFCFGIRLLCLQAADLSPEAASLFSSFWLASAISLGCAELIGLPALC